MQSIRFGLVGVLVGTFVAAIASLIAVAFAAGGHGTYVPARVLFPFSMLLAIKLGKISDPLIAVAIAQFPAYGFLLGAAAHHRRFLVPILAAIHAVAVLLAFMIHDVNFR